MLDLAAVLARSPWLPLNGCWRGNQIPAEPGLYRVRRAGRPDLDYIGQTGKGGMTLRKRLAMQRGVYADEMPYTGPHTAAPTLWAMRPGSQRTGGRPFAPAIHRTTLCGRRATGVYVGTERGLAAVPAART